MKLIWILGDQLNLDSEVWAHFDPAHDKVVMAEVVSESVDAASSNARTVLFLSAMRHFAATLRASGHTVLYYDLSARLTDFPSAIERALTDTHAREIAMVLPGDQRVRTAFEQTCRAKDVTWQCLPDTHFIALPGEFSKWQSTRKTTVMEHWYRHLRKRTGVLMEAGKPVGGQWNFDADNRKAFSKSGPEGVPSAPAEYEDDISAQVRQDVQAFLPNLPGRVGANRWPLNRAQALACLADFIEHRLARFGDHQDAMWTDQPWLFHSRLSTALNLKLLHPMEAIRAAEQAYHNGQAPINSVEGFVRQILGWREFVRGLYWTHANAWPEMNALKAQQPLPSFYWTGDTQMRCLQDSLKSVLNDGYGHHIQRLMVTGLFALLFGVRPQAIDEWYLAMYVDAVDWVETPNTLGMSQYADGGIVGTKPYIASGAYIDRMSNYCQSCPYHPKKAHGEQACPFTTLYWAFVHQHQTLLSQNPRLGMQVKNWARKSSDEQALILAEANRFLEELGSAEPH